MIAFNITLGTVIFWLCCLVIGYSYGRYAEPWLQDLIRKWRSR